MRSPLGPHTAAPKSLNGSDNSLQPGGGGQSLTAAAAFHAAAAPSMKAKVMVGGRGWGQSPDGKMHIHRWPQKPRACSQAAGLVNWCHIHSLFTKCLQYARLQGMDICEAESPPQGKHSLRGGTKGKNLPQ